MPVTTTELATKELVTKKIGGQYPYGNFLYDGVAMVMGSSKEASQQVSDNSTNDSFLDFGNLNLNSDNLNTSKEIIQNQIDKLHLALKQHKQDSEEQTYDSPNPREIMRDAKEWMQNTIKDTKLRLLYNNILIIEEYQKILSEQKISTNSQQKNNLQILDGQYRNNQLLLQRLLKDEARQSGNAVRLRDIRGQKTQAAREFEEMSKDIASINAGGALKYTSSTALSNSSSSALEVTLLHGPTKDGEHIFKNARNITIEVPKGPAKVRLSLSDEKGSPIKEFAMELQFDEAGSIKSAKPDPSRDYVEFDGDIPYIIEDGRKMAIPIDKAALLKYKTQIHAANLTKSNQIGDQERDKIQSSHKEMEDVINLREDWITSALGNLLGVTNMGPAMVAELFALKTQTEQINAANNLSLNPNQINQTSKSKFDTVAKQYDANQINLQMAAKAIENTQYLMQYKNLLYMRTVIHNTALRDHCITTQLNQKLMNLAKSYGVYGGFNKFWNTQVIGRERAEGILGIKTMVKNYIFDNVISPKSTPSSSSHAQSQSNDIIIQKY